MKTEINSPMKLKIGQGYPLCSKCNGEGLFISNNKIVDCWCLNLCLLAKQSDELMKEIQLLIHIKDDLKLKNEVLKNKIKKLRGKK